jgi:hypothetical protein
MENQTENESQPNLKGYALERDYAKRIVNAFYEDVKHREVYECLRDTGFGEAAWDARVTWVQKQIQALREEVGW